MNDIVFWTGAGDFYHASAACTKLRAGVKSAEVHGRMVHPMRSTSVQVAEGTGRGPCAHCMSTAPYVVSQQTLPQTSNREAQTVVKLSDGTRLAVYASGKVKVGRDNTSLSEDGVTRFNFGPGHGPNASPASSFVHLVFKPR